MTGRRTRSGRVPNLTSSNRNVLPHIYQEMLSEAYTESTPPRHDLADRPLKRRRVSRRLDNASEGGSGSNIRTQVDQETVSANLDTEQDLPVDSDTDGDDGLTFEDVLPPPTIQTLVEESEESEFESEPEEDGFLFEDVDLAIPTTNTESPEQASGSLELNLTAQKAASSPSRGNVRKRKPLNKVERERRAEIHRLHLLCLLFYCHRRNSWCNDEVTQRTLKPLLTKRMVDYLNPSTSLSQFGRTESLKNGLQQLGAMFKLKFAITERGFRRALWAQDEDDLRSYEPPSDLESCRNISDFREVAKSLGGSRDVGAQLYCALLRAAGVRARLVCSLQPLSFLSGGPTLPKPRPKPKQTPKATITEKRREAQELYAQRESESASTPQTTVGGVRRRPMHPAIASHYQRTGQMSAAPTPSPAEPSMRRIRESPYPIFWVEVLDVAHQKWQPVDPLVTKTFWRPRALEPPLSDRENCLTYVVAFDVDGTARDVTRRYAKAFMSKTRKMRAEVTMEHGDRWWQKTLDHYSKHEWKTDLEQIEDTELSAISAREPMPRNIADFKGHPLYALERHLRRHEVLLPGARNAGTVAAGSKAPPETVYLRKDVKVVWSREKWYRQGRMVKDNVIPAKFLPKTKQARGKARDEADDTPDEDKATEEMEALDTPLFTMDQTVKFRHPPVVEGRVPKNKFGNIDIYVPSMVPRGGVHIRGPQASRAAFLLGIDYSPALTGFNFRGRQGTAVLDGAVVAEQFQDAVLAVVQGLQDLETEAERERKSRAALEGWRRLLMGLRIRQRVWAGVDKEKEDQELEERLGGAANETDIGVEEDADIRSEATEEYTIDVDDGYDDNDYGGGGFVVE